MEDLVNPQLTSYIQVNNVPSNQQYAFRKDSSTTFLMLDLFVRVYSSKEKEGKSAVMFLVIKSSF